MLIFIVPVAKEANTSANMRLQNYFKAHQGAHCYKIVLNGFELWLVYVYYSVYSTN